MKSYSTCIQEFSTRQRKELEALFIVLDWAKNYQKTHPNNPIGQEWMNATELTIRIIYEDALNAMKNEGIAFHSGLDTTEAPPELISSIIEELSRNNSFPIIEIESPYYYYFGESSTSSENNDSGNDMVNLTHVGPSYRISENGNPSTEDIPFGFQFPHLMRFNFGDKMQRTSVSLNHLDTSVCQSTQPLPGGSEQKELFLPFPTMYPVRSTQVGKIPLEAKGSVKSEGSEIFQNSQLDLSNYDDSSLESESSNPAIEFFRISSGFIPPPKNSEIAKRLCTSPFCLCSIVKAACNNGSTDSLEDEDDLLEEIYVEPYLEVENISLPKLVLPDLLNDTPESFMLLQPYNTPNNTEETLNESAHTTSFSSLIMPGTPRNNPADRELLIQHFNTPVTPDNISVSSNTDTSFDDSLGVAELDFDEDIAEILQRQCSMDNEQEYIRRERLRILYSYEKSRQKAGENNQKQNEEMNFATSTPNRRHFESSEDNSDNRDC